jgi:hypothetical protein
MLVIAFYFAYGDEFSAAREQSSFDPIDKTKLERYSDDRNWDKFS